jgi:hypothetical protein
MSRSVFWHPGVSPEYTLTHRAETNLGFLRAVYATVLGRGLDFVGQFYFGQLLALGIPRPVVATLIVTSVEAEQRLVQSYYQRFLHRAADRTGLDTFVGLLQRGDPTLRVRDEDVLAAIVGSAEYFARL